MRKCPICNGTKKNAWGEYCSCGDTDKPVGKIESTIPKNAPEGYGEYPAKPDKPVGRCKYCGMDIAIRNPSGNCDHLYYPENCNKDYAKIDKPAGRFDVTSIDARVWAKEFMRIKKEHHDKWIDESLMIGWFANSIMAGYDEARRRLKPKPDTFCKGCGMPTKLMVGELPNNEITILCKSCWDRIEKLSAKTDIPSEKDGIERILYDYCHWFKSEDSCKTISSVIHKYISDKLDGIEGWKGHPLMDKVRQALGLTGGKE